MSACFVIQCAICDKAIHHGTYAASQETCSYIVPFSVFNTVYYVCTDCEANPLQKIVRKHSISCKPDSPCFYCDICAKHSEGDCLRLRWGSWGKDVCSTCSSAISFRQFMDGCKSP